MRILISGGGSDIGRALVERRLLVEDHVAITSSKEDSNYHFSKTVSTHYFDLLNPNLNSESLQKWIEEGVDGLILNAATRNASLLRLDEYHKNEMTPVFDANIMGNIWLLQRCLKKMVAQKFGRIIFISSIAVNGASRYSLYSASKAAVEGLIRGIATDYGEFNITANIIRPGVIETERTRRFWKRTAYVEVMQPVIPLMRFGQPSDIASASDLFLSKDCYATGSVLELSGGLPQIRPDSLFKVGL